MQYHPAVQVILFQPLFAIIETFYLKIYNDYCIYVSFTFNEIMYK